MYSKTSNGFTLVELLIAVTITGTLVITSTLIIIMLFSTNTRIRQIDALASIKSDIVRDLTEQIRWAKKVVLSPTNDEITITTYEGNNFVYKTNAGNFTKNDKPLHSAEYEISSFTANDYNPGYLPSIQIVMAIRKKNFTAITETYRFVVSNRQSVFIKTD